jgi:Domain of unknown function (DUF4421)
MKPFQRFIPVLTIMLSLCSLTNGQKLSPDTSYYISQKDKLGVSILVSQKFAPLTISSSTQNIDLNYRTNLKLNLGAGLSYKGVSLNLSYGFKFLNTDKGRGLTKGLDLQLHFFPGKYAIDLIGIFPKGYYLDPNKKNGLNLTSYYQRPDLQRNVVGLAVFRVPNANKFSYKAALTQNDWQIRSAGSLLYGGNAYFGKVFSDSALVPLNISNMFQQHGINEIKFFSIGPGIGYAYTLVIDRHLFITASFIASVEINFSAEDTQDNQNTKTSIKPGGIYKGAIGYNSSDWCISASIAGNALYTGSSVSSHSYFLPTGGMRLILTKKFTLKKS